MHILYDPYMANQTGNPAYTTREKPSSSAGSRYSSSAGSRTTDTALQLNCSSSACVPSLLLYKGSSSEEQASALLLIALAHFTRTRYC